MTNIGQSEFEKFYCDLVVARINELEDKVLGCLRKGKEGVETDFIYKDGTGIIGIEHTGIYQKIYIKNKNLLLIETSKDYSKDSDIDMFLREHVRDKISKNYEPARKWLVIGNRFPSFNSKDFEQIFLSKYQDGWGSFERVFVIFDKFVKFLDKKEAFEIYEVDYTNSKLIYLGDKEINKTRV